MNVVKLKAIILWSEKIFVFLEDNILFTFVRLGVFVIIKLIILLFRFGKGLD